MMSLETAFEIPLSIFEIGFLENSDSLFPLFEQQNQVCNPAVSNSGSDEQDGTQLVVDERKRRRMDSNRESARRSRIKKQKHLENLTNEVSRLRTENREMANRLAAVSYHFHYVSRENDRLRAEILTLRRRLLNFNRILVSRQLHQIITSNERIPQLIT